MDPQYLAAQVEGPANAAQVLTDVVGLVFFGVLVFVFAWEFRRHGLVDAAKRVGWAWASGFAASAVAGLVGSLPVFGIVIAGAAVFVFAREYQRHGLVDAAKRVAWALAGGCMAVVIVIAGVVGTQVSLLLAVLTATLVLLVDPMGRLRRERIAAGSPPVTPPLP